MEESKEITATIESTLMSDEAIKLLFERLREPIEPRWRVQKTQKVVSMQPLYRILMHLGCTRQA